MSDLYKLGKKNKKLLEKRARKMPKYIRIVLLWHHVSTWTTPHLNILRKNSIGLKVVFFTIWFSKRNFVLVVP